MISFGDVVLVKFHFSNLESTKKRPGLVLGRIDFSVHLQLYIIAMITSKLDTVKLKGDVKLKIYSSARYSGLLFLSSIFYSWTQRGGYRKKHVVGTLP